MTATDYSILDDLADDQWPPSKALVRELVVAAINAAADEHAGQVTIAWVRPHLPRWAVGPQVGAVISVLSKRGHLIKTGAFAESGNGQSRNNLRPVPIYRRPAPLTVEDIQP